MYALLNGVHLIQCLELALTQTEISKREPNHRELRTSENNSPSFPGSWYIWYMIYLFLSFFLTSVVFALHTRWGLQRFFGAFLFMACMLFLFPLHLGVLGTWWTLMIGDRCQRGNQPCPGMAIQLNVFSPLDSVKTAAFHLGQEPVQSWLIQTLRGCLLKGISIRREWKNER